MKAATERATGRLVIAIRSYQLRRFQKSSTAWGSTSSQSSRRSSGAQCLLAADAVFRLRLADTDPSRWRRWVSSSPGSCGVSSIGDEPGCESTPASMLLLREGLQTLDRWP